MSLATAGGAEHLCRGVIGIPRTLDCARHVKMWLIMKQQRNLPISWANTEFLRFCCLLPGAVPYSSHFSRYLAGFPPVFMDVLCNFDPTAALGGFLKISFFVAHLMRIWNSDDIRRSRCFGLTGFLCQVH